MNKLTQNDAPIYEALLEHRNKKLAHFDVPGHKRGRGNPELVDLKIFSWRGLFKG